MHRVGLGRISSASLMLSGLAGVVSPDKFAEALKLTPASPRGITETRAGLGGTYAALGGWALAVDTPSARTAVGVTWLGAGAARLAGMQMDQPEPDVIFWLSLAMELGLGIGSLAAAMHRRRQRDFSSFSNSRSARRGRPKRSSPYGNGSVIPVRR
jgi:hypothetical protein